MLMEFKFNSLDLIKQPNVAICRLDLEMIGYLNVTNLVIKPTFCNVTEVTFTCYDDSNLYDCVRKDMVLEIDGFGRFVIVTVDEESDGQTTTKQVTANSYEIIMNRVTLTYKDNTVFKLWDATNPEKGIEVNENNVVITDENRGTYTVARRLPTLLYIISQQTGWNIKHVDEGLLNSYRTLTIDNEQAYGLLMGDIAEAFKCYFVFDTENFDIYCYERDEESRHLVNSGINLSFRNLINTQKLSESNEDIVTALTVQGAEGVGINLVNPLGNNVIYDFSYYMNDELWAMPKNVQDAVRAWTDKIEANRENWETYVEAGRNYSNEQTKTDGELSVANSDLKALIDTQSVYIAADMNEAEKTEALTRINGEIEKAQVKVDGLKKTMREIADNIEYNNTRKSNIVKSLSFENNFTDEEFNILKHYINGSVYENANFIYTDVMSEADKMYVSNQLYIQGLKVMAKLSRSLYQYECNIAPFMFDAEYEEFTKNLELGNVVNLELEDGKWVTPKIMQVVIDYDNPDNTTVILSDSFRLSNSVYEFSDGYTQAIKAARKTSMSASKWDQPADTGFYDSVHNYITNALNLTQQEIVNADNQEFTLGSYGLRGKMYDKENDKYDPHQVAMTNNVLAFTDDNWNSCRTALGRIWIGEEGKEKEYYGLVAEAIYGRMIAGEELTIESGDGAFKMDGSGVKIENAPIIMTQRDGKTKIVIDTVNGFKIQKLRADSENIWDDVLSEDAEGNIVAKSIKVESGTLGGWTIKTDGINSGIYSPDGKEYILADGRGHLGLMTYNNTTAWFDGNIYANNLKWNYGDDQYSVFNTGTGGLYGLYMNGGWIGDGSLAPEKRTARWDEIYADYGEFQVLRAGAIMVDALKAGYIESEEGVKSPLFFGGQFISGSSDEEVTDVVKIYGAKRDVSTEIANLWSMIMESHGNIYMTTNAEGSGVIINKRLNVPHADIQTMNITSPADEHKGISCQGTVDSKYIDAQKLYIKGNLEEHTLECEAKAKFKSNIDCDGTVNATKVSANSIVVGEEIDTGSGSYGRGDLYIYYKKSDDTTGTLHFRKGILVGT